MAQYTAAEQQLIDVWEAHTSAEFDQKDADAAIATMTDHPVLIHVPVGTGATGKEPLRKFYAEVFIPQAPPDLELELVTRSVGQNRVIDEFVLRFTHTLRMDWFAPELNRQVDAWWCPMSGSLLLRTARSRRNTSTGIRQQC